MVPVSTVETVSGTESPTMPLCLIVQPIHPVGEDRLRAAGITVRRAASPETASLLPEITQADAAITRNGGLAAAAMDAAPGLKVIANHGVGVDAVDVPHATALGIPVCNTPGGNTVSVAEHAMALILALAKQIVPGDGAARAGDFDFRYRAGLGELRGKRLGIVGFGRIGRATAAMAHHGFGMEVLVHSPSVPGTEIEAAGYGVAADLDDLLRRSDVVSLHLPGGPANRHRIGRHELGLMKPTGLLVNTGRGTAIDEAALIDALRDGVIAGAGLDVFAREPMPPDYPLLHLDGVVLSPHTASSTRDCLERMALMVAEAVIDVLDGRRPQHLVNEKVWDHRRR
jgi:D-3-phosphoglycerate dehydrogenase